MIEYEREKNVNTPEYWDSAWGSRPEVGAEKGPIRDRLVEHLGDLPDARVYEYGFGAPHLARMIGRDRWIGRDFSKEAVKNAREEGFRCDVIRCGDAEGFRKSYLVALEVLEHLSAEEMVAFLDRSRNAPHAFFSVPVSTDRDEGFHQHQRGWRTEKEFEDFLLTYWPHVSVERVGRWFLAHCRRAAPKKEPILTVGCSTLMDFWGANYTLMSLQSQWGHLIEDGTVELVLVDNHPDPDGDPASEEAIAIMRRVAEGCGARYVQWCEKQGTYPGKNQLQVEARGKWVLTMDSHVFLSRGTLETVLELIEERPDSDDFFHFPCLHKRGVMVDFRHLDAIYRGLEVKPVYGYTGKMRDPGDPYPVAAMITSAYLVRRAAWFSAKGYDPILGMYGGWEGPLQVKWRLMGRNVLSLRHRNGSPMQLWHWHHFNTRTFKKAFKWAVDGFKHKGATVRYHTVQSKQRNFAASSAVTGGEAWVRRLCELRGWNYGAAHIQEGMSAGLKFRPWMVENLARPEWEDIREFFKWMRDVEKVPGALKGW